MVNEGCYLGGCLIFFLVSILISIAPKVIDVILKIPSMVWIFIFFLFFSIFLVAYIWMNMTTIGKKFKRQINSLKIESITHRNNIENLGNEMLNNSDYNNLKRKYPNVSSCREGHTLNTAARNEINHLTNNINLINEEITKYSTIFSQYKQEWANWSGWNSLIGNIILGCFGWLFLSMSVNQLTVFCHNKYISVLKMYIDDLENNINLIPESNQQKQEMIKELKLNKKELQMQKKEKALMIKEIRRSARQSNAKLTYRSGKYARYLRRSITKEKEQALSGPENIIAMIDSEILDIDKHLLFLEKLSN